MKKMKKIINKYVNYKYTSRDKINYNDSIIKKFQKKCNLKKKIIFLREKEKEKRYRNIF